MAKKVNIIGAGLAGLSAGIYLQEKGFDTEIFELAGWAGGMCTTWVRNGYRFDGCINWMVGTKPGNDFNVFFREVGALEDDTEIYNAPSEFIEINGVMYEIPMEIEKFKALLYSFSSEDKKQIDKLCGDIEIMANNKMPAGEPESPAEKIAFLKDSGGFIKMAAKYMGKSMGDLAAKFQNRTLRDFILRLMPEDFSAISFVMMLGTRMGKNAGYPMGGAFDVIRRMESKYRGLGGKINFNMRVEEIAVDDGCATGIRAKGEFYPADGVIAACDAYDTLKKMLGGKYKHPQLDEMLEKSQLFYPLALISLGLNKKFGIPYSVRYECPEGIWTSPDKKSYGYNMRSFEFDDASAPENCSSVMIMTGAPFDYWWKLRQDNMDEYKMQKQKMADSVLADVEKRIPGFRDAVVVTDVSTPATYARLTNVYKGSYEGFAPTPEALKTSIKVNVTGVKNLLLCGQWVNAGGGICSAVASGKRAADKMEKEIRK